MKLLVMGHPMPSDQVQAIIGAGARGFLLETASEPEIKMALEVVLDGSIWAPRKMLARLLDENNSGGAKQQPGLTPVESMMTPRELDVLGLLMDGRSNREIAQGLGIDEVTVKAHLGRMLRKTGLSNRVELTLRAMDEKVSNATGSKVS
jgi:DNA-binding NarL/FixJ family response regulator